MQVFGKYSHHSLYCNAISTMPPPMTRVGRLLMFMRFGLGQREFRPFQKHGWLFGSFGKSSDPPRYKNYCVEQLLK